MDTPTAQAPLDIHVPDIQQVPVTLEINGTTQHFEVEPWTPLLDLLREHCQEPIDEIERGPVLDAGLVVAAQKVEH